MITVSVIMPYFKKLSFFKKAYYSALNQQIKNVEIIIVYDDEDKSDLEYIKKITDGRMNTILIINNKNLGVGKSRNIGIEKAKGEYISFLDCDDIWNRNKLKYQINFMKKKKLNITYTSYSVINEFGKKLYNVKVRPEMTHRDFVRSCDIGLSTVVIKKSIFNNFRFEGIKTKEDYLLWLQLSKTKYKFFGIKKILTYWRISRNSLSNNILQKIKDSYKIYYHFEKQSFFQSILSIIILSFFSLKKNRFLKL
jgi:teichuronic acid biosynthesis glycosyltransferase TuaG